MAFPTVESVTTSVFSTEATAHAVDMPATVNSGDLLVCLFGNYNVSSITGNPATVATPAGWTQLSSDVSTDAGVTERFGVYYKSAAGTEGGGTVDFVTSESRKAVAQVYRVTGWSDIEVGSATTGTGTAPDSPSLSPSWGAEDTLWLSAFGVSGFPTSGTNPVTAYPTNYTDGTGAATTSSAAQAVASARRENNTATEDPGAFTKNGTAAWVAQTVAIRPGGGTISVDVGTASEAETANPIVPVLDREVSVGQSVEAEFANPIQAVLNRAVSVNAAAETEAAQAITPLLDRAVAVGQTAEAETANPITPDKPISVQVGTASEAETANTITPDKPILVSVGQALEAELARLISPSTDRQVGVGQATEAEAAQPITPFMNRLVQVGQATESELAQAFTIVQPRLVEIGRAVEVELGRQITPSIFTPGLLAGIECEISSPSATCSTSAPSVACSISS